MFLLFSNYEYARPVIDIPGVGRGGGYITASMPKKGFVTERIMVTMDHGADGWFMVRGLSITGAVWVVSSLCYCVFYRSLKIAVACGR